MKKINYIKQRVSELSRLIKEHGYWSDEVNSFNNKLIEEIGCSNMYVIIQEMSKNKILK